MSVNSSQKRVGVAKIDFKPKKVKRDKEGHMFLKKIQQEDITVEMHMHPTDEYQEI